MKQKRRDRLEILNKTIDSIEENCLSPLYKERNKLRSEEQEEKNKKLIGSCFKYHNSCGDDKWWLYMKVIGLSYEGYVVCITAEKNFYGDIEIKQESVSVSILLDMYIPIPKSEFSRAFNRLIKEIQEKANGK